MNDQPFDLDPVLIDRFAAIVGDKYALRDQADIAPYITERRGLWHGRTSLVLRPGSVEEVSRIMRLATETGTPVVPQSGNTGLVGAQVPDKSGHDIVLSLSRLNRIREIDVLSNTVTAEAGVILQTLQEAADAADRLFPLSLAAQGSCQIGGNLSSNAGGTGVLAYGNARELCLGVEVVLPTGEVFDDLRKLKKDNTGYDLKNLFVGAEGTLGVITAAVLKLFPKPKGREVAFVGLPSARDALSLFSLATDQAGASLTAFELIGRRPYDFTLKHGQGITRPLADDWPWYVLMQISSGRSEEDGRALIEEVLAAGLEKGIVGDAVVAASLAQGDAFWNFREVLPECQKPEGASIKHDISVPIASIPDFIEKAASAVASVSPGARVVCFGHMGDGNLHYNISRPEGGDDEAFLGLYRPMNNAVHDVVRSFHGSISAEHGIGQLKRDELIATAPPMAIDLMRRVKAAFDPAGIMNPGKVI
ncbi:FAD-binding oxidoreductase [Mesorhizobium sp. M1C.F.Ca.ET.193.01.1.1]|uniref:FAD-binding oxidoreductase n=1 Tax=unclassified Mesorhizobium TaxID=325217 RepID=UPI000FD1E75A|nr:MULTISPECIES: FAD-binding oxidoreductase [unclassified Mesorhizobium]TGS97241.1 FAD-binding oxidoreductase [bacterium M00.F.Ca.ET.177.01.1.1]RWA74998.1 MAG: FAD-binding oxidoreductase [Mesorhizobium sp.]RWC03727.1 MAG: FAD-binding oxidoreductase [Mesorhizobium sp.]RWG88602.1 MAG: FAD-binding oxidoreductase [Mesorhizobium sp.]RWK10122.1 MAG: FAD-binding oxidoreductase [Mesorhizobium sp.]